MSSTFLYFKVEICCNCYFYHCVLIFMQIEFAVETHIRYNRSGSGTRIVTANFFGQLFVVVNVSHGLVASIIRTQRVVLCIVRCDRTAKSFSLVYLQH